MLGAHLGPRARSHIEQADVVFVAASDALVELWVERMRPDARSLQPHYADGKSRRTTYREMVDAMLAEVRAGHRTCAAFYGHPGVFTQVSHQAIAQARRDGYIAVMEAAVSSEDCLYADLGIDPGHVGCQHCEATQFMIYQRRVDPSAYLVLWQVAHAGDRSLGRFSTDAAYRRLLVDRLREDYPVDHEVLVYEAATSPIGTPRMERIRLDTFPEIELRMHSTLVVPPAAALLPDRRMLDRIDDLEARLVATESRPRLCIVKD